jgi:hypothetical protein
MRLDDSVQDALNILTTALHGFKYYVLPASDDAKDVKIAAFIADQLGIGRPSFSKYAHFRVLLKAYELALIYGYSAVEIVTETLSAGRAVDMISLDGAIVLIGTGP